MRAVICRGFENEDQIALEEVEPPAMVADGVRIKVMSSGVSFANLLALKGKHQNRATPPFIPGTEIAGVVLECGADAVGYRPGERVMAGLRSGGFADEVVVTTRTVFALPAEVDFDTAVQFPTIYATAYGALKWRACLSEGETLLVHGAAGGSGLAAVEIGKILGARVIATAGSAEKLAVARAHGADMTLNYRERGFREAVLEATGERGADVIFDPVGGAVFDESLRCIAPEGRIIPMGFAGGDIPQIPANILLVKNITVVGFYWGYYVGWGRIAAPSGMAARVSAAIEEMLEWVRLGRLRPLTHRTFPLEEFRAALAMIVSREVIGKLVLHPQR